MTGLLVALATCLVVQIGVMFFPSTTLTPFHSRVSSSSDRTSLKSSSAGSVFVPRSQGALLLSAVSVAVLTRLPVEGRYFWDLFPAYVLGGARLAFAFVSITIASLAGVSLSDAGVASGLITTSRQIGGAVGLAAVSAIAATSTSHSVDAHPGVAPTSPVALDHGFLTTL
jgi:hypothetical protein